MLSFLIWCGRAPPGGCSKQLCSTQASICFTAGGTANQPSTCRGYDCCRPQLCSVLLAPPLVLVLLLLLVALLLQGCVLAGQSDNLRREHSPSAQTIAVWQHTVPQPNGGQVSRAVAGVAAALPTQHVCRAVVLRDEWGECGDQPLPFTSAARQTPPPLPLGTRLRAAHNSVGCIAVGYGTRRRCTCPRKPCV